MQLGRPELAVDVDIVASRIDQRRPRLVHDQPESMRFFSHFPTPAADHGTL
ncbi:hypothetical protein [Jiangella endophytica]|uniref:hypothetical protein n=1 Tax=Jiangella endophytica TaxID=1623398 RepID=UPI001300B127|nr:hypothetical protein [Jiangella endophytica]